MFPRDKVCGDAIGGRVKHVLKKIDPSYLKSLESFPKSNISSSWSLFAPNGKSISLDFVNHGYVSKREDFDNFLLDLVKEKKNVHILEDFQAENIEHDTEFTILTSDKGEKLRTKLLIGCDGAHSIVAKKLARFKVDLNHYSAAVRAYYKNVQGIKNSHSLEIHLIKNYLPGYFWIFPLDEHSANIGFGMLSSDIKKRKVNLKGAMEEIIHHSPSLAKRFENAELIGNIQGFGLPLGGLKGRISGTKFMLCGDAASLIDPLNGEGIGNAMWSGYLAAGQAERCFEKNDFSSTHMTMYDQAVYSKLGQELKSKLFMQKAFNRSWLINLLVNTAIIFPRLKNWFGKRL